jgi:hypothetical protein
MSAPVGGFFIHPGCDAVSEFCPDGYLKTPDGITKAARRWFTEKMAVLDKAVDDYRARKSDAAGSNNLNRVLSQLQPTNRALLPDALWPVAEEVFEGTVNRLRNLLHKGALTAFTFGQGGPHAVPADLWATPAADGMLEQGAYWLQPLFLREADLDALNDQAKKKPVPKKSFPERSFPLSKMQELEAAVLQHKHLSRKEQREAVRSMFPNHNITVRLLRETEQKVDPRTAGRK